MALCAAAGASAPAAAPGVPAAAGATAHRHLAEVLNAYAECDLETFMAGAGALLAASEHANDEATEVVAFGEAKLVKPSPWCAPSVIFSLSAYRGPLREGCVEKRSSPGAFPGDHFRILSSNHRRASISMLGRPGGNHLFS